MVRRLSVAAALWLLAASGPAQAMGLGDIKVKSSLNQRFSASIPFTSLTPEEAANVRARLADNEAFQRAGLDRSAYIGSIQVDAVTDGPNPRLELSSKELAREPLLTLLVEVRTPGGMRMLREYTVLLDPAVTPATLNSSASSSEFFQTPEEARSGTARGGDSGTYGPVGPSETLWMVAQAVKPPGVSLDQAMLALYETNRGSFRGGDIDALRKGSMLEVPSAERMQAVGSATARARVLELSAQDQGTTVAKSTPFSTGEAPAPRKSTPPPAPPVAAAAPVTPPATETPPPAATPAPDTTAGTTTTTPSSTGEAAAPASGETAAPAATETTDPAAAAATSEAPATETLPGTPATDGTDAAPPADAAPAAVEETEEANDWISTLIPILIGLIVLLIGFAVWRSARERKAQREYEKAARESATSMPSPRLGAQGSVGARAAPSARAELEALDRQIDDDATRVAEVDGDATRMVTTSKIPPYTGPQAADQQMDEAEQEVSDQFQANTKEIKLGDNDPLSEADFHLAYGLYDEAALLLQQASARAPQRTDLRVKLAETYFAAGKPAEFEQVASGLKEEVSDEEWGKLAIMGRQIAPASALFQGEGATTAETVLDLNFDDDATQIAPVKVDEGLEFRLEELELPTKADSAEGSRGPSLEFDLGEFDLSGSEGKGAGAKAAAAPQQDISLKDFDLGGSDLAGPGRSTLDVQLDEVEPLLLDDPAQEDGATVSSSDDAATKLDLARAYVEMGDAEMARSLLDEVARLGTDEQKREAGALRERLLG